MAMMLGVLGFKVHLIIVKVLAFSAYTVFFHLFTTYLNVQLNHSASNGCLELKDFGCDVKEMVKDVILGRGHKVTSCVSEWVLKKAFIYMHLMSGCCCLVTGLEFVFWVCFGLVFFLGKSTSSVTVELLVISVILRTCVPRKRFWLQTTQYIRFQLS